jgi:hypothetical protein
MKVFVGLVVLGLLSVISGCGEFEKASQPASPATNVSPPPQPQMTTAAPASGTPTPVATTPAQPSDWKQGQIEEWLKQELKLTELKLSPAGEKSYKGNGQDVAGKSYQLKVIQSADRIVCEHSSGAGSTGEFMLGNNIKP